MTGVSAALAFRLLTAVPQGSFAQFAGMIGVIFFGLATLVAVWRIAGQRGPVITLSPQGIRDTRLTNSLIPWTGIRAVSTWTPARRGKARSGLLGSSGAFEQRVIVLAVDPETERDLELGTIAKWTRRANKALGADGLAVTAAGIAVGHERLLELIEAYREATSSTDSAGTTQPLAELFMRYEQVPVDESLDAIVPALAGVRLLVPLAEEPVGDGNLKLLTAVDARGLVWAYLYSDHATAGRSLPEGTRLLDVSLADALDMVEAWEKPGGIRIDADDQTYLSPDESFVRLRDLLTADAATRPA
jgi:hypothetical protein